MNLTLAIITAIGSVGGLGGIVMLIFRAGGLRQELREAREDVKRIDERGCMFRLDSGRCVPEPRAVNDGV